MTNKINKKSNNVVREMKECFRFFHLPVNKKNKSDEDFNIVFTSEICNDHVCAVVGVVYDKKLKYVAIEIHFQPKVSSDKLAEIWRLFNLLNRMMPLYHYAFCTCCNGISLEGGIFLSDDNLPVSKFSIFLRDLLKDSYLCAPLIKAVAEGGNPEALHDRFRKDNLIAIDNGSCSSKEIKHRILSNVETVLAGLQIEIEEENKSDGCFVNFLCSEAEDFHLRMGIKVIADGKMITLHLTPSFTVPDEKIPVMTELIGRINKISIHNNLFIQSDTKRISLLKGIIIDDVVLNKKEFKLVLDSILACGRTIFPIIKEQISSNESPAAIVERILGTTKCNE
jgi:hypothetical protein